MREPYQVLIIPFRRTAIGLEFAVLKRSDTGTWQFASGGGEDGEMPIQSARREILEEVGIDVKGQLTILDSTTSIPKSRFHVASEWGDDVFVIPEHSFAVDVGTTELCLSHEHTELRWASYEQARALLKWDSNRTALWELRERLKREATA